MKPNNARLTTPIAAESGANGACLHCGKASAERFCCPGCRHVHEYLAAEGLSHYYDLMSRMGRHAPEQSIANADAEEKQSSEAVEIFRHRGSPSTYAFHVPALSCAACLWLVERIFGRDERDLQGIASVRVNLDERMILIGMTPGRPLPLRHVLRRLAAVGYKALPPRLARDASTLTAMQRRNLQNLGIAGAVFGNVMLFASAVYFGGAWDMTDSMRRFFDWFSLALTTISLLTAGRGFFSTAWATLRRGVLHVDLPIAAALSLSYGVSLVSLARGEGPVYFDSVSGLIFLLLAGRYLNDSLQARARRLAGAAAALVPDSAARLKPGDCLTVAAGEVIPVDGVIERGASDVDESALTGEQMPVAKRRGDAVAAGTQNLNGALDVRVLRSSADSYVARISRLVDEAVSRKSRFETMAARWLPKFVAGIFASAGVALIVWLFHDPSQALIVVTATLIVSCPCALALATPLTMAIALRRSWRHGVIVKSGAALEAAASVDAIVLDKTGTLTSGQVRVTREFGQPLVGLARTLVVASASRSRHPVARAVVHYLEEGRRPATAAIVCGELREVPGAGLEASGLVDGRGYLVKIGTPEFVERDPPASRASVVR